MVESAAATAGAGSPGRGLVLAMRPDQWVKNVLVVAAPLAAGILFEWTVAADVVIAFVCFCLAASAGYLVNDTVDIEQDRRHPAKRHRPLAAGRVTVGAVVVTAVILGAASLGGSALTGSWQLGGVLACYLLLSVSYSLWLKHQAVLELAAVSGGFLLRAVAGGAAAGIPLSRWFLIVAAFGSLFMVAGKRYSELITLGDDAGTRSALAHYTPGYLRFVWGIAAAVTVMAYCLWAFEVENPDSSLPWGPLSVIPFVVAMLRYAVDIDQGRAGEPERIALGDRVLQVLGVSWLLVFAMGAFGV